MATPVIVTSTTIPAFDYKIADISRGVCLSYYGTWAEDGAEPGSGWLPLGALEDGGITMTDKPTVSEIAIEQMYHGVAAYLSKRDTHTKMVFSHCAPEVYNLAASYPPSSLTITPGDPTSFGTKEQFLGEPGDVGNGGSLATGAGDTPTSELTYYQFLFLFPSPGFNFATTPNAKWAAVRFWKAYVSDPTDFTTAKAKSQTIGCTFHALSDLSVSGGKNKVGVRGTYSVMVP